MLIMVLQHMHSTVTNNGKWGDFFVVRDVLYFADNSLQLVQQKSYIKRHFNHVFSLYYIVFLVAKMALLMMIALLSVTVRLVDSANNKDSCDFMSNINSCTQTTCVPSPCTMLCGLKTPYDKCSQICGSQQRACDNVNCRSKESCEQTWSQDNGGSMTCDSKDCDQICSTCNMSCVSSVTAGRCKQICTGTLKGGTRCDAIVCNASNCTQTCGKGNCNMDCPLGVKYCSQNALGNVTMLCEGDECKQICQQGGCDLLCLPRAKSCTQIASAGNPELSVSANLTMRCQGDVCTQACYSGYCDMTCPLGVKTCTQSAFGGNVTMKCDGDVCEQFCYDGECNLICSASVTKCSQLCRNEKCTAVKLTSSNGPTTTKTTATTNAKRSGAAYQIWSSFLGVFQVLMLALIVSI